MDEKRYRLRIDQKITGYMREVSKNYVFYSLNGLWWTGREVPYKQLDEYTGFRDKNDQHLYEWDIIKFRLEPGGELREGVILWNSQDAEYGIKILDDTGFIPLEIRGIKLFEKSDLIHHSYLFINPELMQALGLEDH